MAAWALPVKWAKRIALIGYASVMMRRRGPRDVDPGKEQENQPGSDQHDAPDDVEIDPGPAQYGKPNPGVDQPSDRPRRDQHRDGVNSDRQQSGPKGAGEPRYDRVMGAMRGCRSSQFEQHRHDHEPRAVRGRHQERPEREVEESDLHSNTELVAI